MVVTCISESAMRELLSHCSLIPRPSHCPVFDCLQYAKAEGEGLVQTLFYHVNDILGSSLCISHTRSSFRNRSTFCVGVANEKLTFNRSFVVSLKYLVCVN